MSSCVQPDGKPTQRAIEMLKLINQKPTISDQELSTILQRPLFQIRASLRELESAGFIKKQDDGFDLTKKAKDVIS
ncbi:MAG: phage replisome organizer N-terminal domain-containing protein [Aquificaceae bacterium]|nr:phage replisome organizer N-terminal domain-containing protein [Aquificaceae bacterium]MDW8237540.1 hypothetical protein [Aquificaceae bacterium]